MRSPAPPVSFGPKLTELANHLAYGGTLVGLNPLARGETEIVFVDTSGFRNEDLFTVGQMGLVVTGARRGNQR